MIEHTDKTYRSVPGVAGLECSRDGLFRYRGRQKKPIVCHTVTGRKATVRSGSKFSLFLNTNYTN